VSKRSAKDQKKHPKVYLRDEELSLSDLKQWTWPF